MAEHEVTQSVWKRPVSDKAVLIILSFCVGTLLAITTLTSSWTRTSMIFMVAWVISIAARVFMRHRQSAV